MQVSPQWQSSLQLRLIVDRLLLRFGEQRDRQWSFAVIDA
jgi:hypothetical protein